MSEKTEAPSSKRLEEAREKGQIARSAEVSSTAVFFTVLAVLGLGGFWLWDRIHAYVDAMFREAFAADLSSRVGALPQSVFLMLALLTVPVLMLAAVIAVCVGVVQTGGLFAIHPILPDPNRINPAEGMKRVFSRKGLVTLVMLVLKFCIVGGACYAAVKSSMPEVVRSFQLPALYIGEVGLALLMRLMLAAGVVFVVMSAVDYALQHHWHIDGLKQDKHEVKQDAKEMEGDPDIKHRRREMAKEIVFEKLQAAVKRASVVVVNPTHVAVAICYRPGETDLPVVVAKGVDEVAATIRRIAEENGIPIVRNVQLARELHASTPVDAYIGLEHFEPVADLLAWVKSLGEEAGP